MKSLVIGFIFLGLANLGIAQQKEINTVALEEITLSVNSEFLESTNDLNTPEVVWELNTKAAAFDPRTAEGFNPRTKRAFIAVFKATNGRLHTAYGPSGEIISSRAKFSNVTLPLAVRKKVFANNEGWMMTSNQFVSTYDENRKSQKKYKISMANGDQNKLLIVDFQ